jgi:hypothetical protein
MGWRRGSHYPYPRVRESWDGAPGFGGEGLSPWVLEPARKDLAFVRGDFPVGAIMLVMRVEGEDPKSLQSIGLEFGLKKLLAKCMFM